MVCPHSPLILGSGPRDEEDVIIERRQEVSVLISIHVNQVFSDGDCLSNDSNHNLPLSPLYLLINDMVFFIDMVHDD